jgi:hypothetical protein
VVDDERTVQTAARLLSRLEHGAWDEAEEQLANASDEGREQVLYACGQADKTLALARRWTEARPCTLARTWTSARPTPTPG